MKNLTALIMALLLLGCPPAEHKHPEMTNEPKVNEIQNTHSGVIWRVIHTPEGAEMHVTKTAEGWLLYRSSSMIMHIPDKDHKWLQEFNLSNGVFDSDGEWIPNNNVILEAERKLLKAQVADLEIQNKNLHTTTLKALERSRALEDKSPHRDYKVVKELNDRLKTKNQALEEIITEMSMSLPKIDLTKPERTSSN